MSSKKSEENWVLEVKVSPKASRNAIVAWQDQRLKVSVTAVPDKGKANQAVIKLLAKQLGIARSAIELQSGHGSREKRFLIHADPQFRERLPSD